MGTSGIEFSIAVEIKSDAVRDGMAFHRLAAKPRGMYYEPDENKLNNGRGTTGGDEALVKFDIS